MRTSPAPTLLIAGLSLTLLASAVSAVPVLAGDTEPLPGTTSAVSPELAGIVMPR